MSIGSILKGVGGGLAKAGKVAGAVLEPVGMALAEEESGQLPQLEAEKRQRGYKQKDEETARHIAFLENQRALDEKYNTLKPEQRKALNAEIDSYGRGKQHPSMIQKLHQIVHPGGATYQAPIPYTGNAAPEGGTAAADEKRAEELAYAKMKQNLKAYKLQDGSIINIDATREIPPAGAIPVGVQSITPHYAPKEVNSVSRGGKVGASYNINDGKYYDANGKVIEDAIPIDKPGQPKAGTVNGKPSWGLLTSNGWVNPENNTPIPGFQPAPNYAQIALPLAKARAVYGAEYGVANEVDDQGNFVAVPRIDVINKFNQGTPYRSGNVPGSMQQHALLAQSAIDQVNRMERVLEQDPNLTGPGNGQLTQLQMFLGTQSPEAQEFLISGLMSSEHGVAVFGGRNIHTIQDVNRAIGSMKTNPRALRSALEAVKETMSRFASAGGRMGPRTGAAQVGPTIKPTTGARTKNYIGKFVSQGGHLFKVTALDAKGNITAAEKVE